MFDLDAVRSELQAFPFLQTPEYNVGPANNVVQITLAGADYKRLTTTAESLSVKLGMHVGIDDVARAALLRGLKEPLSKAERLARLTK